MKSPEKMGEKINVVTGQDSLFQQGVVDRQTSCVVATAQVADAGSCERFRTLYSTLLYSTYSTLLYSTLLYSTLLYSTLRTSECWVPEPLERVSLRYCLLSFLRPEPESWLRFDDVIPGWQLDARLQS